MRTRRALASFVRRRGPWSTSAGLASASIQWKGSARGNRARRAPNALLGRRGWSHRTLSTSPHVALLGLVGGVAGSGRELLVPALALPAPSSAAARGRGGRASFTVAIINEASTLFEPVPGHRGGTWFDTWALTYD